MGNRHSALLPLDCFAKVGRQSLPAWALVHGKPMYSSWNLVATPAVPLAVVLEDRSLSSASGQDAAGIGSSSGKAMPHAVTHTVGLGFYSKICAASPAGAPVCSWKLWKTFLKIKLDYYMGYDRN